MKYTEILWRGNPCNDCHSNEDIKVIQIGNYNLVLCKKCREKLSELLLK